MRPEPFALERYFARYEFASRYLLASSDPEAMTIGDLLALEPDGERRLRDVWLGYTESRGAPALRRAIARDYKTVDEDGILVHAGSQEPIFAFMNVALQPGDHAIVQFPAYQSHYSIAHAIGAEVSLWPCDLAGEGAPDPDELARLMRPTTKAIVITSPNNPTGYVFDRARLDATIALARKTGAWIFSDEMYRGSERDPADRLPPLVDIYERGISLGGFAKAYGLAGLRIGWIATRDRALYRALETFKDYLSLCNSAPSELLATIALDHRTTLVERVRDILHVNLDVLDAFFGQRRDAWEWRRPRAGTTAFPRYLKGSTLRLCERLAEEAGVLLLPSSAFDAGDDRVRFGYGRKNLPEAIAALGEVLDRWSTTA